MLHRLDRGLCWLEEAFITALLITASVILFVNVVARYGFNTGFVWAEEFVRYEIIWMVFIGGSVAARKGIHIGVNAVFHVLPQRFRRILRIAVNLLCIGFCAVLLFYGAELVAQTRMFGQKTPAMQVPFWIVQMAIPVGAALMLLRFAQHLSHEVFGEHQPAETEIIG